MVVLAGRSTLLAIGSEEGRRRGNGRAGGFDVGSDGFVREVQDVVMPRFLAAVVGCLVLVGCVDQPAAPPPLPSSVAASATPSSGALSSELCLAAAAYRNAANALVNLDAAQVGVAGVKNALQNLQTAASDLADAAKEQFAPQVAELERAVASLQGAIAGLSSQDSLSTNLGKIAASVGAVEQAAQPIMDSVRAGCPAVPSAKYPS